MSRICIVLLAAGNSSRFGSPKLLSPIGDSTLIAHAARAALKTGVPLIVVTGAYAEQITAALEDINARLIHNSDWEEGMGTSIATAFRHLLNDVNVFDAAIVCPADMPLVGAAQFQRLIDAHQKTPKRIIVSDLGEAQGPPCLFPRHYFEELTKLHGPQGARTLLKEHKAEIISVAMPEAAMDIDTPDDYARWQGSRT
ncbi:MAG: nucleotidyltransferase family protein [Pseudomonadota bacterium]